MTDIRQVMMPVSMIVLQTGWESWITLKRERKYIEIDFSAISNFPHHDFVRIQNPAESAANVEKLSMRNLMKKPEKL